MSDPHWGWPPVNWWPGEENVWKQDGGQESFTFARGIDSLEANNKFIKGELFNILIEMFSLIKWYIAQFYKRKTV